MTNAAELTLRRARWQDAIDQAGEGDPALLEALLRSDWTMPDFAREWLADRAGLLAKRRRGRPSTLGDRLLAIERRHYAAMNGWDRRSYAVDLAEHYGVDLEVMEKMLRTGPN